ncbi:MAG TPA: phosphoadenylyl-sulfate reductase [Herpetosiphonaceae bacterium]
MLDTLHTPGPEAAALEQWNVLFRTTTPQTLLAWASRQWDEHMALTCSFGGAAGLVLLDMIATVAPHTPVLYIDTGLLFDETYRLIDEIRQRYEINLIAVKPARTVAQQALEEGESLWRRDPDRCCGLRKVQPLGEALKPYAAWVTGVRRGNSHSRANTALIEWSSKYHLIKLNPLAFWNERDVWRYMHEHHVPYNPLLDQGYRSIGCYTCTSLPTSDAPRSGRWAGFNKTECGLHLEPA